MFTRSKILVTIMKKLTRLGKDGELLVTMREVDEYDLLLRLIIDDMSKIGVERSSSSAIGTQPSGVQGGNGSDDNCLCMARSEGSLREHLFF